MKIRVVIKNNVKQIPNKHYIMAVFNSADDLLSSTDYIKRSRLAIKEGKLYKYKKKYILLFPDLCSAENKILALKEYSDLKFVSKTIASHIEEYGNLICKNISSAIK